MDKKYEQFVYKLNSYIRKFYFYQLIRGLILFILLIVSYFAFVFLLEYFSFFNPDIKLVIFLLSIFLIFVVLLYFVILPTTKLLGLGKRMTYYDVSDRLSKTYPEIKDKLINIVELENENGAIYSSELKRASIDQKIDELKILRFSDSIRFNDLKIVFGLMAFVVLVFSMVFMKWPEVFKESSVRLVHFQQKYVKPAPFTFNLLNTVLEIETGQSIDLELRCDGREIPETMYVNAGGNNFLMAKSGDVFKYRLENVNSSLSFYFTDKQYISDVFKLVVLSKPFISSFSVEVQPPSHTNLSAENLQNIGDLKIASGSVVHWKFNTVDADSLFVVLNDGTKLVGKKSDSVFEVSRSFSNGNQYQVFIQNSRIKNENSLIYEIQTIADLYPEIKVVQANDSMDYRVFHFKGNMVDDYGFHKLSFTVKGEDTDTTFSVLFTPFILNQDFYYSFNFESVRAMGKSIKYYFSVYDNDFISGFKRTISETFTFNFPDYQDILAKEDSDQSTIDQLFKKSTRLTEEIQQDFKDFRMKQIDSDVSDWDKFQSVKNIMNKKTELESTLEQIKQQNRDANNFLNSFSGEKSDILKKQEQIDELIKDVFNDELKKLFDEFNELAKQFDSRKFEQLSEQMDFRLDDLSKQLDKNLQLLKKMKVEQKVERVQDEISKLAEEEKTHLDNLNKRSELDDLNSAEKENLSLFENLEKDYKGAVELNQSLEKPINLLDFDREFSNIKENYERVIDESGKENKRKTLSGLEENRKSLEQLSFAMDQMIKNTKEKQNQENIEDIRQILENLLSISFDQERILEALSKVDFNNPIVNELKVKQMNLGNQLEFVKDSLQALARRTPEIGSVVDKEMLALENSIGSSLKVLGDGSIGSSRLYQQYGITAANNLVLFLSEVLENLKEQEKNGMPGDGESEKSGKKSAKPGLKNMKESQSSIKEQLQQMIDQMKKGEMGKMSKAIGQTLAQQEMMQQMIRELLNSGSVGSKAGEQLKIADLLLEQSRKDLINKNITSELIQRQNLILSKLLDAEKAEIERDEEDKRESKTALDIKKDNPAGYFEYNNKLNKNDNELIRRNNYKLRSFYEQKYNNFLNQIKN